MKKLLIAFMSITLFIGCTDLSNTPIKKTEDFLSRYQTLDNAVLTDLDEVILQDTTMNEEQKKDYKDIMKKHYQNLTYEVKDEVINGDDALVTVEITVTDFKKIMDETSAYMNQNIEEFYDDSGNYSVVIFTDYRLSKLKDAKEEVKYTIDFLLTKVNNQWQINELTQDVYDKINGLYDY